MGILDKFSKYADVIKLGLTKEQAQHLDEMDGEKDNKYKGKSLFDVISEHKTHYDNGDNKNVSGKDVSFYQYLCNKMQGLKFTPSVHCGIDDVDDSPSGIADQLIDAIFKVGTGDLDTPMSYIDYNNIVDVLSLYQEKANKKNSVLGVKYDSETLFEAILDENIPKEKKKEYLQHLTQSLLLSTTISNDKYEEYEQKLNTAIDNALSKNWPNQSSSELDSIVEEIINFKKSGQLEDGIQKVEIQTNNLDEEINKEDILGNGKLDNPAKQISINCRVHALINGILATEKGENYLNSLIHKDKSTGNITIYLPGAKEAGLPKPKGDGKYTYTENQILNNINKAGQGQIIGSGLGNIKSRATSIGDGDETALLMAMQDFLIESKGQSSGDSYPILSSFTNNDYTEALFGKEIKNQMVVSNEDNHIDVSSQMYMEKTLEEGIKKLELIPLTDDGLKAEREKQILNSKITLLQFVQDNKKKFKYLKDVINSNKCFIQLSVMQDTNLSDVKQIGTKGNLLNAHAYAIKDMGEETITLVESNNPKSPITIGIDDFFNKFDISIYTYPEDVV